MDFKNPEVDFTALAMSMGVEARCIEDPADLRDALESSFANKKGPNLIEVMCDSSL